MIIVKFYEDPGLDPKQSTDQHPDGIHIITTSAGVLEIKSILGSVLKAYAPGRWIEAWHQK